MNAAFILALQLLLAHLLTDFLLQTEKWIIQKQRLKIRSPFLYIHSILAGLLTYIIVQDWTMWFVPIVITLTHFAIDLWKLYKENDSLKYFLLDQFFHLIVLLIVWLVLTENFDQIFPFLQNVIFSEIILSLIIAYLLVIFPVGFVIGKATQRWQDEITTEEGNFPSLKKAGRYIGIFERILVLTFILSDNFAAIGFLIAAKSILRFSDKEKNGARKQTEYVLIGTLMSFAITIIIGFLCRLIIY